MKPLKDKKITIYAEITDENGTGYTEIKYRPIHPGTVWAYMRDMSAREYYAAGAMGTKDEGIFVVNWRAGIEARMCLTYRGKWYQIEHMDAFEGYKEDLRLYVSSMRTPKDEDILPYQA